MGLSCGATELSVVRLLSGSSEHLRTKTHSPEEHKEHERTGNGKEFRADTKRYGKRMEAEGSNGDTRMKRDQLR